MTEFEKIFGKKPSFKAEACGRVNLIGDHTDYNGGFVLPMTIGLKTEVMASPRQDNVVCAKSFCVPESESRGTYTLGSEHVKNNWLDYLQGITSLLRTSDFKLDGFNIFINSEIPMGRGLSSSAALEVSVSNVLRKMFSLDLNDLAVAKLCQRSENDFVGAKVGIMDPMAVTFGKPQRALFLDTRDLSFELIELPLEADLIIIDSGISHQNRNGTYNQRRKECEEACQILGVDFLRDVGVEDLNLSSLPPNLKKRAQHVVTENARVIAATKAIKSHDLITLGGLFTKSHVSMKIDYEISTPEIDLIVELALGKKEVFGARMTGGGCGGSVLILAHHKTGLRIAQDICKTYQADTKVRPGKFFNLFK